MIPRWYLVHVDCPTDLQRMRGSTPPWSIQASLPLNIYCAGSGQDTLQLYRNTISIYTYKNGLYLNIDPKPFPFKITIQYNWYGLVLQIDSNKTFNYSQSNWQIKLIFLFRLSEHTGTSSLMSVIYFLESEAVVRKISLFESSEY